MENKRYLLEYFTKDMAELDVRKIAHEFENSFVPLDKEYIREIEGGPKKHLTNPYFQQHPERIAELRSRYVEYFKNLNDLMMDGGRNPLFKDPDNLVENLKWFEQLSKLRPEEECDQVMGATYRDYQPEVFVRTKESGLS